MRVLTRLTSPEATSDIAFLVFVSATDEFELAGPVAHRYVSASGCLSMSALPTSVAQSSIVYDENAPTTETGDGGTSLSVYKDVFGEQIVSLRSLLHRSSRACVAYDSPSTPLSGMSVRTIPLKRLPPVTGIWNNAWYTLTTPAGSLANLNNWHPLTWFTYCFAGYSGSTNVTINALGTENTSTGYVDSLSVTRATYDLDAPEQRRPQQNVIDSGTSAAFGAVTSTLLRQSGASGMALTNTRTNAGLSVNLPYYNSAAFYVADPYKTYNNGDSLSGANSDWWQAQATYPVTSSMLKEPLFDIYYGSGPDFNLHFFVCCPILYSRSHNVT